MNKHTIGDLYQMQSLPLKYKIMMTKQRIQGWYDHFDGQIYVSFSGGKDSTVLLDIVRNVCGLKDVPAVFVDVPTQYPELREFAKTFDNVTILKPKISFMEVCEKYGFPFISKEVSGAVYDAKKYLDRIRNRQNALTDRQTDRQTDRRDNRRSFSVCRPNGNATETGGKRERDLSESEKGDYP